MSDFNLSDFPSILIPPCKVDRDAEVAPIWSGRANLLQGTRSQSGVAEIVIDTRPRPEVRFTFQVDDDGLEKDVETKLRDWLDANRFDDGVLKCESVLQDVSVRPDHDSDGVIGGSVSSADQRNNILFDTAEFVVVNGPLSWGTAIASGRQCFKGRQTFECSGFTVTLDRLSSSSADQRKGFQFSHIAQIQFFTAQSTQAIDDVAETLFRCLSLMRGGWVALAGPWLYRDQQLVAIRPDVTKCSRQAPLSWCPKTDANVFGELFGRLHAAQEDAPRKEVLETAIHWLVEAHQCAGGVEGSIVLLQAALESLAWFEIVQARKQCSTGGFEKLTAADKIRWFLSLFAIPTAIPKHCDGLDSYLDRSAELNDLPGVLTDVRNALVHGTPSKVQKLLQKDNGTRRRTHLWYLSVGVLEQAILAVAGYQGQIVRRDLNERFVHMAVRPVPWKLGGLAQ